MGFEPMKTREVADLLGISPRKVRALIKSACITGYRIGNGHWMLDREEILTLKRKQ